MQGDVEQLFFTHEQRLARRRCQLRDDVEQLTEHELATVERLVHRLLRVGRPQYGPLTLDDRSLAGWLQEALDEHADRGVYLEQALALAERLAHAESGG